MDLFHPFLGWWRHHGKSKLQNFEIVVSKRNTSPQILLYYWLPSYYRHWYMKYKFRQFLTQFWVNDVKLPYFEKLITETNSPHLKVPSNSNFDFPFSRDTWYTTFGPFLTNLEIMASQRKYIFQKFEKLLWFSLLKIQMAGSVEVSILILFSQYITLKVWKCWKMTL